MDDGTPKRWLEVTPTDYSAKAGERPCVSTVVFTDKDEAQGAAVRLRGAGYSARVHPRRIKVDGCVSWLYFVVVRRRKRRA